MLHALVSVISHLTGALISRFHAKRQAPGAKPPLRIRAPIPGSSDPFLTQTITKIRFSSAFFLHYLIMYAI